VTPREIVLLGSTGSIGTQAIDIVRRNPDRFRVVAIGAGGGNVALLAAQALELGVEAVGVARASVAQDLQLAFYAAAGPPATSSCRRSSPGPTR
jgi:1-deoxy-D-xylulose-5-phosphate reductoisomerase